MFFSNRLPPFQCLLLGLSLIQSTRAADVCYYPDGSVAKDYVYVSCGSNAGACCIPDEGDVCLSNGLCYYPSAPYVFRGACTDQTWKSSSCPQYCNQKDTDSWESLVNCGGTKYCCSSDGSSCCSKSNLVFDIGVPSVVNNYGSSVTYSSLIGGPTTWQKTLITTDGTDATATDSSATTVTGGSSGSSSSPSSRAKPGNSSHSVVIGVVVGVGVFLVLAIIGGLLICCLRKRSPPPNAARNNNDMTRDISMRDVGVRPGTTQAQNPPQNPFADPQYAQANPKYAQAYPQQQWNQQQTQWNNAPPIYQPPHGDLKPYQVTPMGGNGHSLVELQSPVGRPRGPDGKPIHEIE